ncbi:2-desacetyl-2-hydroxyethyl bacteriochlorophyllide A dehydrogenase [Methylobacterium indicum]|uniref:chlorophyll synthesis pathway protein BchC n=1 Tax=Methylobacterium indicum TaxID=1775910 RepID=UPI000733CD87|nr:chlorophyll synthesis pathway protein BchC [Methylobacterium indicum]KTS38699.1 2-desacetyl-2-hydroxyethyl bacteriochlorophyllide A dehydrogenase [Methylobacterium indicum]KTS38930.1 2-desacetyl-2-hydroxyethyl bacteriochlorophyllide A dehydrogenase [Methylobacterium indicum]KTS54916.1 2-desacetyl-2-hydroxyethyl bacteriochlorophyllide A dehydrogenase [Methylobacterium indicum]
MHAQAVILDRPERLGLADLALDAPGPTDAVVAVAWSGISTGTERLLWSGRMPDFPGMGYPLVPGYESVGIVVEAGSESGRLVGEMVFVPGARCFGPVRGLFGGAASHLVSAGSRLRPIPESLGERGILLALAATARHALEGSRAEGRQLVVGHGVLGRLLARLLRASGLDPVVWERDPARRDGADDYAVIDPSQDETSYARIIDASGDAGLLDTLIARLQPGGEVVLAGFYEAPLAFAFPPAFLREARIRVAAQWQPGDLDAVAALAGAGTLSLDGLVTHRRPAGEAAQAYPVAFGDPACLKMVLDWRAQS